ncbi:hypothetical protein FRC12_013214 [Ceratobasidium sp. 428]|nr:hypothetical protein FRC12_013214 [Ceratobasidium sp. 428]
MSFLKSHAKPSVAPEVVDVQDPPDEPGHEMTGDARVWKTYVREADKSDKEIIEERSNSLDVLLIFVSMSVARVKPLTHMKALQAALFSAVSTAFLIESLGDLKPDPAESSAKTLRLMSQTLAAIANGQTVTPPGPDALDDPPFSPSKTAVVVNLLWLLSLSLSIAVSLVAMLAKEWCYKFMSGRVGPAYEQARRRQLKWNGMERWKMKEVLTYLPGMMHAALLLFAVGLCLYLWDISTGMAIPVITVTSIGTLVYVLATILPAIDRFCPYSTPAIPMFADTTTLLAAVLRKAVLEIANASRTIGHVANASIGRQLRRAIKNGIPGPRVVSFLAELWYYAINQLFTRHIAFLLLALIPAPILALLTLLLVVLNLLIWLLWICCVIIMLPSLRAGQLGVRLVSQLVSKLASLVRSTVLSLTIHYELSDAYSGSTKVPMDLVTSQMLAWLIANCENSRSVDIALQAIAGADDSLPGKPLAECRALKLVLIRLETCTKSDSISSAALQYYRASGVLASGGVVQATEDRWGHYSHTIDDREISNYRSLHQDHYDAWNSYCSYAYLANHFVSDTDLNTRAIIAITIMPFCHWKKMNSFGAINLGDVSQEKSLEITTTVLKQHIQTDFSALSTVVLTAIVKFTTHYLVGLWPREEPRSATPSALLILLSHVFFKSYGTSPDTARAVAITLAAAVFAIRTYPGGERPQDSVEAREKRAVDVYKYYRTQESLTTDTVLELFIFGFFGLLPEIDFSDESTRAAVALGNFRQLLRRVPRFDLSQHPTYIHTLPQGVHSFNFTILEPGGQSLISFANDASPSCEIGLAYSCLPLLIHQPGSRDNQANLYIPALIALCRADSVELQDFCLHFIDAQPIPRYPLYALGLAENCDILEKLCHALIDCHTPVASIAALHFELLVARIITYLASYHSEISDRQSALQPLLNLQGEFAGRTSQPKQLSVEALLSGLGKCCEGDSIAEDHVLHTIQSVVDFCEGGPVSTQSSSDELQELQKLKSQLGPGGNKVARHSQAQLESIPLDG